MVILEGKLFRNKLLNRSSILGLISQSYSYSVKRVAGKYRAHLFPVFGLGPTTQRCTKEFIMEGPSCGIGTKDSSDVAVW